jgi:hypothetical protein
MDPVLARLPLNSQANPALRSLFSVLTKSF